MPLSNTREGMNDSAIDYSIVLTELIQKQMVLIGPDLTFEIVKKVGGLRVDQNGVVMRIDSSDPRNLLVALLNELFALSELIAKKSVEILVENYPELTIDPKSYGIAKKVELPPALSEAKPPPPPSEKKEEVFKVKIDTNAAVARPIQTEDKNQQPQQDQQMKKEDPPDGQAVSSKIVESEKKPQDQQPKSEFAPLKTDESVNQAVKKINDMFS